jgi:glycosyltransferase involved in cell wall biosynthesis
LNPHNNQRVLYVSHNGMLENLGQAQVLPYLRGLAKRGFEIDLLSYELPDVEQDRIDALQRALRGDGIAWSPLRRARDPRLRTKVLESAKGVAQALRRALERRPAIVHGRSYLPTAVADLVASTVPRARLVFDCRGMLGDEYVDAGYWTEARLEYRLLKAYERRVFRRAEGVVVLTETLKRIVETRGWMSRGRPPGVQRGVIEAIPCCVDMARFRFDGRGRVSTRFELGFDDNHLVILYSGSLGGWYQDEDLATFVGLLARAKGVENIRVLLLTHQNSDALARLLSKEGIPQTSLVVRRAKPEEMARYLSAGDLAISFIKSCFSKLGSSPTKVAEYLACGLPVVLNGDIGDQVDLAAEEKACVVLPSLAQEHLEAAVPHALLNSSRSIEERAAIGQEIARRRFDLEGVGVARYEQLYRRMLQR